MEGFRMTKLLKPGIALPLMALAAAAIIGLSGCPGSNTPDTGTDVYALTFDSQGGSAVEAQTVESGGRAEEPPAPARPGYAFAGWHTDPAGTEQWDFAAGTVSGNITLYAAWTRKPADPASVSALQGAGTITIPDGEGGAAAELVFNAGDTVSVTIGGETARYPCVITDDAILITKDGGEAAIGYAIADGKLHIRGGLDKIGNSLPAGAVEAATEKEVAKPEYVVSFNTRGGSPVAELSVTAGGKLPRPADPLREGYVFAGWHTDPAGTELWDFDTGTVTAAITLYAKWTEASAGPGEEPATYVVSFNPQGGSYTAGASVAAGGKLTKPADPVREGYAFAGWHKNAAGTELWDFDKDTVAGNMTLHALWTALPPGASGLTLVLPDFADAAAGIVEGQSIRLRVIGDTTQTQASVTVTGEFDSIAWREGTRELGTGSAFVFRAADFGVGTHYISVEAVKDGVPWSREFTLAVEY
jgi:uncharacterized repeat protein (TIGR02543 family)